MTWPLWDRYQVSQRPGQNRLDNDLVALCPIGDGLVPTGLVGDQEADQDHAQVAGDEGERQNGARAGCGKGL